MKQLPIRAVTLFFISLMPLSLVHGAQKAAQPASADRSVSLVAAEPCTFAHSVAQKLGVLATQIKNLPNPQAFGAANGELKTVVACRLTEDDTYTYSRLLSFSGVELLSFKGDETPQQVIEALARRLGLPAQRLNLADSAELPVTYLLRARVPKGQLVRLTVTAPVQAAKTVPAGSAPLSPVASARPAPVKPAATPARPAALPVTAAATPARPAVIAATAAAPIKPAAVPVKSAAAPVPPAVSPVRTAAAPVKPASAHGKGGADPVKAVAKAVAAPVKVVAEPAKIAAAAVLAAAAPVKSVAPPVIVTAATHAPPPAMPLDASVKEAAAPIKTASLEGERVAAIMTDAGPVSLSTADQARNIWELYLLARANDPDVGRSQARLAGSKADVDITFAGLLPRVGADAGISFIDQTVLNYAPGEQHGTVLGRNYDVTARVPILNVPTLYNLAAANAGQRGEEAGVTLARQNLMVRYTDAYFGVLKSQADQEIAREEIARLRQVLEQAQAFLKAGTGDVIAVYEAQARLDSVVADLNRAASNLRLAEQRLTAIVGKEIGKVMSHLPQRPQGPDPMDLEWWIATMEKQDPQVRQAREGVAQTQQLKKAAKAGRLPVLEATGGYNVNRGSAFLPNVETRQWSAGASISLPIFSGGETTARIKRAVANEAERGFILDLVLEQRRDNLSQSYFNLSYNVSLIKALEQRKSSAEVQLNAVKKGRSIGTRTAIDLLNAEEAYAMAERDLKSALYDNMVRLVQLKAAAGVLSELDIAAIAGTEGRP